MVDQMPTIEGLARAAEAHRARTARGPLPTGILDSAVRLCRAGHPLAEVANAGRMSVGALARRLDGRRGRGRPVTPTARPRFVALRENSPSAPLPPSWIEIERADGAKLRLTGLDPRAALALFLEGRA